jgi:hypothetical protein
VIDAAVEVGSYDYTDLSVLVADLAAQAAAAANVPDVRLADKASNLAYGGWRGALAAAALVQSTELRGLCVITTSELSEPVIEALAPRAAVVIRGRR